MGTWADLWTGQRVDEENHLPVGAISPLLSLETCAKPENPPRKLVQ